MFHAVALRGRWKEGRCRSGVPQEVRPVVPVATWLPKPTPSGRMWVFLSLERAAQCSCVKMWVADGVEYVLVFV